MRLSEIIQDAEVHDRNSQRSFGMLVKYPKDKVDAVDNTHAPSELRAWVCGKRGYTELYSTNVKALVTAG